MSVTMEETRYKKIYNNPPSIKINKGVREVVFTTISPMNNTSYLHFKKDRNGYFTVNGKGESLSNWQMPGDYITDLTWAADDGDWDTVINVINSGVYRIESVRSRV